MGHCSKDECQKFPADPPACDKEWAWKAWMKVGSKVQQNDPPEQGHHPSRTQQSNRET
jgi:hypothetical protein